ncbi:glycosyltransferase family 4 protein [Candidatus Marsarchaeota archaeon]|nr:glycosyltransferase family 4 protein [Candidatus Marsarchaeota archaeon]
MDICVLNPFFYPYAGGTEKVLFEVYKRLAKRHNVTVISSALDTRSKGSRENVHGIDVVRLKTTYIDVPVLPMPFPVTMGLRDAVEKENADIYHINNRYLYFFDTINAIKKKGGKIALTLHDALPKNIGPFTDNTGYIYDVVWGRKIIQYADVITGVSRNTIETTVPAEQMDKAFVIYNGVDSNLYRHRKKEAGRRIMKRLGVDPHSIIVLNNGRLVTQKGQIYLIRAFAEIMKRRKDNGINLVIIGKGPLKDTLWYMAKDLGVGRNFKFQSGIPESDMPLYYNISDVFVSASLYEPASISIMEALASEVPVVASKVGGVPEMMKNFGIYVKPKSIEDIREGVMEVLTNREAARRRAAGGRKLMLKEHDWDEIAKKYERVFELAIKK